MGNLSYGNVFILLGDRRTSCKIMLFLEHTPEKFKLSNELAQLLNLHTETKPSVIMAIWQYVKVSERYDIHDDICDEFLRVS